MMSAVKKERFASAMGVSNVRVALKWLAHVALFPLIEASYTGILRLTGILLRPCLEMIVPSGEDRVLVVAPHPDDETLGCGGTLGLHANAGDRVYVLIVTDGGRSRAGGLDRATMISYRRAEAERSITALSLGQARTSIELEQLGLVEGRWQEEELERKLNTLISELQPSILYTPSRVDFHPEHLRVAGAVAKALRSDAGKHVKQVRAYELQVPLTPVLANVGSIISSTEQNKDVALSHYRTQSGSFLWLRRHARYLRALYHSREPIEVFWQMEPALFIALHNDPVDLRSSRFLSIRLRPSMDLAAWLVGIRARQGLRMHITR